jgi:hypothetical protein
MEKKAEGESILLIFFYFIWSCFQYEKNQLNVMFEPFVMFLFVQALEDALAKQEELLTSINRKKERKVHVSLILHSKTE